MAAIASGGIAELHPNAVVLDSPAITMLFTIIRDKRTTQRDCVGASDRLMAMLAEEGLARLPCVAPTTVETPCGAYAGLAAPPSDRICGVDIVRSGGILLEAVRRMAPDSKTAKILIQRDEATAEPKLFYAKLPPDVAELWSSCATRCSRPAARPSRRSRREAARAERKRTRARRRRVAGARSRARSARPSAAARRCAPGRSPARRQVLKDAGVAEESITFLNVVSCPRACALAAKAPACASSRPRSTRG